MSESGQGQQRQSEMIIPPAAIEITALRSAAEAVVAPRIPPATLLGVGVVVVLAVGTVVGALLLEGAAGRFAAAGGLIALLLVAVVLVLRPLRAAAVARRERLEAAASALESSADHLTAHLASIGYAVPAETAVAWLASPEPTATVPLVHDSVIAARWWRPAEGDDRVFVEAYLVQEGTPSTLPVLPPLR